MAWQHPELREGEKFLGNFGEKGFREISRKTKRKGDTPYGFDKKPLLQTYGLFPVFVQESERKQTGASF